MIERLLARFGYINKNRLDHKPTHSLKKRISEQAEIEEFICSNSNVEDYPWVKDWLCAQKEYLKYLMQLKEGSEAKVN